MPGYVIDPNGGINLNRASWWGQTATPAPAPVATPTAAATTPNVAGTLASMAAPPKGYGAFNVLDPNAGPTGPTAPGYGDFSLIDPFAGPTRQTAPGYGDFSLLDPTLKKPWWLAQ